MSLVKITKEDIDSASEIQLPDRVDSLPEELLSPENIHALIEKLDTPVDMQKDLAARLKLFIEHRMDEEMREKGVLSDYTRRWVSEYNDLLDKIQKNLYGDKSSHLHVHEISHSKISSLIRKYKKQEVVDVEPSG